jgi:hypothetical protein
MAIEPEEFAALLGAEIVGEVPDVGGGPFGMARLARIMHRRLTPSQGERPGRPTDAAWENRPKVPMTDATHRRLTQIAEQLSTPERRVSPMQVAAQLLEEAVARVPINAEVNNKEAEPASADVPTSKVVETEKGLTATAGETESKGKDRKGRTQARHRRARRRPGHRQVLPPDRAE